MGYNTTFKGKFHIRTKDGQHTKLNPEQIEYLKAFSGSRRMKRDAQILRDTVDLVRVKVDLPVGEEGCYYVGSATDGNYGQNKDSSIDDYNNPPKGQPGLWCQWVPTDDGSAIEWNEGDKFYYYVEWLQYINDHFLKRWGYTLYGNVTWQGEASNGDYGTIYADLAGIRSNSLTEDAVELGEDSVNEEEK